MIAMREAVRLYNAANNAGRGFVPYCGNDTSINGAIELLQCHGWTVVLERYTSDDVAVLTNDAGKLVAIGGDASGRNAWACDIEVRS